MLVKMKTNLKSLRYGKDQLGGGYSGQPYIQVPIPVGFNNLQKSNNDFILRGGALAASDSITDVKRLGKMFADPKSPSGVLFISKQNLLSRTAVRTQTSGILNEGVYTPLSTLTQASLTAFGGHVNKQGTNFFDETGAYSNNPNLYSVKVPNNQHTEENRLVNLYQAQQIDFTSKKFGSGVTLNQGNINVLSYTGGPGSILGVGNTNIRYAEGQQTGNANSKNSNGWYYGPFTWTPPQRNLPSSSIKNGNTAPQNREINNEKNVYSLISGSFTPTQYVDGEISLKNNSPQPFVFDNQQFPQNSFTFTQTDIEKDAPNILGSPSIQDFRKIIRSNLKSTQQKNSDESGITPNSPDYSGPNSSAYEKRVNIGGKNNLGPGNKQGKNLTSYSSGSRIGPIDKINAFPIYKRDAATEDDTKNDLVKFRIAIINNQTPTSKTFMHFRAFLDNFSDNYNATWNPITYLGRGENFYTYNNFTRAINIGWTVVAQSKEELIPMYKKLNYLASSLAPDYTPKGYMAGNLIQLTVGGYLYEQPGFFTSLTYDISDSTWEIGLDDKGGNDKTVKELPKIIKVTAAFTPIHDFIASKQNNAYGAGGLITTYGPQRYIALKASSNNNNYDE